MVILYIYVMERNKNKFSKNFYLVVEILWLKFKMIKG